MTTRSEAEQCIHRPIKKTGRSERTEQGPLGSDATGFETKQLLYGVRDVLVRYADQHPCAPEHSLGRLMALISEGSLDESWGLQLVHVCDSNIHPGSELISPEARQATAFLKTLPRIFEQLDHQYGAWGSQFRASLPEGTSAVLLGQWSNPITRYSLALTTDWLFRMNGGSLQGTLEVIGHISCLPQFRMHYPAISSDDKHTQFVLRAAPKLTQAIAGMADGKTYSHRRSLPLVYLSLWSHQLTHMLDVAAVQAQMQNKQTH